MKEIIIKKDMVVLVDDEDYEIVNQFKWSLTKSPYTYYATRADGKKSLLMHRVLLGLLYGDKREVDHKNGNGLDNRKENLRIATHQQNAHNQAKSKYGKSSQFKGVTWHKRDKIWRAQIKYNKKKICIGNYKSEIEAAQAYDLKAGELFKEYARLNFGGR